MTRLDTVERAVADIAAGKAVVVIDDEDRENEGDLIFAAEKATPGTGGLHGPLHLRLPVRAAGRRDLRPAGPAADVRGEPGQARHRLHRHRRCQTTVWEPGSRHRTGPPPCDCWPTRRASPTTSPSPATWCRCAPRTAGCCAAPATPRPPSTWPGWPGLQPAGAICEIVSQKDEGAMAQTDELRVFADEHDLALISIADLIEYRRKHEKHIERVAEARIPTRHGEFRAVGYTSIYDQVEHVALVRGDIAGPENDGHDVLVRVHSECLTGDVFGSRRCDCGPQLDAAMAMVAAEGRGVVLYMRGHEGRGIGLMHKLQAYQLAGRRRRHRGRQPGTRLARRCPRLRDRRADPGRSGCAVDAAADQQPGQARRSGRLRPADHRAGAAAGARQRREHPLPQDQARPDGPRPGRPGGLRRRGRCPASERGGAHDERLPASRPFRRWTPPI